MQHAYCKKEGGKNYYYPAQYTPEEIDKFEEEIYQRNLESGIADNLARHFAKAFADSQRRRCLEL